MAIDICVRLGRRIQQLRSERGIFQEDLAASAQITRKTLSFVENGKTDVGIKTLARIASALGVKLSELVDSVD